MAGPDPALDRLLPHRVYAGHGWVCMDERLAHARATRRRPPS